MEFKLTDVAQALGLTVESDARVTGWSVDSRTIAPGDLFFALRGPNHDGNAYVDEVLRKGAVAAIANESAVIRQPKSDTSGPVLVVPDTLEALQSTAIWALGTMGRGCDRRDRQRGQNVHQGCDRRPAGSRRCRWARPSGT